MSFSRMLSRHPRYLPIVVVFFIGMLLVSLPGSRFDSKSSTFTNMGAADRSFYSDTSIDTDADSRTANPLNDGNWLTVGLVISGLLSLVWLAFYLESLFQRMNRLHRRFNQAVIELKHCRQMAPNDPARQRAPLPDAGAANWTPPPPVDPPIEEDQLTPLLKMAGSTAHGLNQPLMALLGNIELMKMDIDDPQKLAQHMTEVDEAGNRIARLVKKIQNLHHDTLKPPSDEKAALQFDHELKILSIEDLDTDFSVINSILETYHQIKLSWAKSIEEASGLVADQAFDLVFLDYMLPDGNGLEFLKKMNGYHINTPVVVITGQGDEMIASKIIQAGAYDYLPKSNINPKSLTRIINNTIEKYRLKQEVDAVMKKMAEMSIKDELTGLYNRRYFEEALRREMDIARRYHQSMTLCMMDLDHFKQVNDTYGHPAGDMVLREFSRMLKNSIRSSDVACRFGGEEFCLVLPNTHADEARKLCERFRKMVARHQFHHDDKSFNVTVSVGIAAFDSTLDLTTDQLVQIADDAMYLAKQNGRNRVREMPMAA